MDSLTRKQVVSLLAAIGMMLTAGCIPLGYDGIHPENAQIVNTGVTPGGPDECTQAYADVKYTGPKDDPKVHSKLRVVDENGTVVSDWVYSTDTLETNRSVRVSAEFCGGNAHYTGTDVEWRVNENGRLTGTPP